MAFRLPRLLVVAPVVPFFLFAVAFLVIPSASLFSGSFQNQQGQWTLQNIGGLATPSVLSAFSASIQLSLVTALLGGVVGLLLAWAALRGGLPAWTSPALLTFCGVASNFAGNAQFLRYVALPVLLPSLLGTMILLFGNAFGAYATAYALTGGTLNLAPILVGAQIRGDVLHNPNLGYALAFGMVVVMAICLAAYSLLQRRSEQWIRG